MATANSTRNTRAPKGAIPAPNDEARRRSGALKCVNVLRALENAAAIPPDDTAEAFFAQRAADAKAFAAHFGPMSPEVEGVITALAEYIHTGITTGQPNLDKWLPVSAKTEAELMQEIRSMEADHHADDAIGSTATVTTSKINPASINPLIAYANDPGETARSVSNVLAFMGFAFRRGIDLGSNDAADGVGLILESCAAALDFHTVRQGGAE